MNHKPFRRRSRISRSRFGVSLIETLVALIVGSIIAITLTTLFSATMRNLTSDQNLQTANSIAQELLEYTRSFDYPTLSSAIGTYELLPSNPISTRAPVIIDLVNKSWSNKSIASLFKGTATYSIQPGTTPATLIVTIVVGWSDSSNVNRQILTATVVTQYGSKYWQ